MDVGRVYLSLAILVVAFWIAAIVLFETPSLQFSRMDYFIWPAASVLAGVSTAAIVVPLFPAGRRLFSKSSQVPSLAVGYVVLLGNSLLGLLVAILVPFRLGI